MASSSDNTAGGNGGTSIEFKNLVVVREAADHYYIKCQYSDKCRKEFTNANAPVYATIMKEWKILEKNLPESIYVQIYETRMDLLRAVIIGSPGTPYHDGLFFFDIMLPSTYPDRPPKVYYHSHGYRLNPNINVNGYVCLSLVNAWSVRSWDEFWSKSSTILQVLVSIQGLVLNDRPYGSLRNVSNASKWIKASDRYNEDVFINSCRTMLNVIQKPPMNFEDFVAQHFRARASSILAAIHDYQEGVSSSPKFKADLEKIKPRLRCAFAPFLPADPNKDKASSATTAEKVQGDHQSSCVEQSQENATKHTKRLHSKFIGFVKKIWKPKPRTS